jgi:hypothetical protein
MRNKSIIIAVAEGLLSLNAKVHEGSGRNMGCREFARWCHSFPNLAFSTSANRARLFYVLMSVQVLPH